MHLEDDDRLGALFEDLEQQAAGIEAAERDAELADRARGEYSAVTLADRVHASVGLDVALLLHGGEAVAGHLAAAGRGWCAVRTAAGGTWVVRLAVVAVARGMSPRAVPEAARPAVGRLGLGSALHHFGEGAPEVRLHLMTGGPWHARVVRVGADFVEVLRVDGVEQASPELVGFEALRAVQVP